MRLGPKTGGGELGGFFCPCYVPHHSLLFPSQAVRPNRYLNFRRISAGPGLRPGPWGSLGGGAGFPGAHMAWGGALGFPWCQYLRPGTESWSLLPVRPGQGAGSGGEKLGGGGRSFALLFIA